MSSIKAKMGLCGILLGGLLMCSAAFWAVAEEKPEAGNEGGGKEAAAGQVPKDQREYTEKTSKLNGLSTRIEDANKRFQELVREKNEAKSQVEKQAAIKEMVELVNQRNKDVDTYNQLRMELGLRYPNQGQSLNRSYEQQRKRSVEEMETTDGLDELLTRVKKQIEKKYAPFNEAESKTAAAKKIEVSPPKPEETHRLRLEK